MNAVATPTKPTREARPDEAPAGDIYDALRGEADACRGKQEFYTACLRRLAEHFDAPFAVIQIDRATGTFQQRVSARHEDEQRWNNLSEGLLLKARYQGLSVAKLYRSESLGKYAAAMSVPVSEPSEGAVGALCIVVVCETKSESNIRLSELKGLITFIGTLAASLQTRSAASEATASQSLSNITKAAAFQSLEEYAFAIANGLKSKIGCDQVSLGLVQDGRVRVLCISGFDDVYPRSPGSRLIQQAMEECLDAGRAICYQQGGESQDDESTGHLLHKQWHEQAGGACVASIPLTVDDTCIAVLSVRNSETQPFTPQQLDQVREAVTPLTSGLILLQRANLSLLRHASQSVKDTASRFLQRGAWGRKIALAAAALLMAWLIFGTKSYIITVPCEVVPSKVRHIAAPFEGTIASALVKPGDWVAAGTVLLKMDKRELITQREKLTAKIQVAEVDMASALTAGDQAAASQAKLRMDMDQAELDVVNQRIEKATIRAPSSGMVLSGDLAPRVGEVVPLGEELVRFVPRWAWSLELHVPEFAAAYLDAGQLGEFTTTARPEDAQPCTLERLEPATKVVRGHNVFLAKAKVQENPAWIRVGMTGVARIDAGRKPVWWVGLHRVIDTIRLQFWKL